MFKYIFGPVPSRRLGLSLGIDLVPHKTCNFNCIYCECGKTTNLTNKREEFFPLNEILNELKLYLTNFSGKLDYITFSGSGEPLLYSKIENIVAFLKKNFPEYKLALLTNGALLSDENIIKEVKDVDLIIPSLDAVSDKIFKKVNRPHLSLNIEKILDGLVNLRKIYKGKIYLEIFFVKGINDSEKELVKLKKASEKINPDKIHLNTVDRPPAEPFVKPVSLKKLKEIEIFFGDKAEIAIRSDTPAYSSINISLIKNCLKRRPLTLDDLIKISGLTVNEINKILRELEKKEEIKRVNHNGLIFYKLA